MEKQRLKAEKVRNKRERGMPAIAIPKREADPVKRKLKRLGLYDGKDVPKGKESSFFYRF